MEFARYEVPLLRPRDTLFAISNSGSASRTRETVMLARARGNFTVGITGAREGPLATLADVVVYRPVRDPGGIDPTFRRVLLNMIEYLAALYTLYLAGIRLGGRTGLDAARAAALVGAVEGTLRALPGAAAELESVARDVAKVLQPADTVWVIGAGPNAGTARYGAAKFHEQLPLNAIPEDLEEWAHLQYFLTLSWKERSVVWVLAPPGNAWDRAQELVEGIAGAGGRAIVVTQQGYGAFPKASARFDLPAVENEWLTPILYHLPIQLVVLHLARLAGLSVTPLRRHDDYWLIRRGIVRDTDRGLV
jgi:glucosamine--fructose-6-phosphate aminotransferase (isomerizing)